MTSNPSFILASASPRRNDLLSRLGLSFEVIPADTDETLFDGERPGEHTRRLAEAKARAVAEQHPGRWSLGADTIVFIDDEILGKPADEDDAFHMLQTIAGRRHTVVTSFCVANAERAERALETVKSLVFLRELTPEEIRWYIATGEPMDKAGSYAVQGIGASLVTRIEGSYTNVVGLPLAETVAALERLGVITLADLGVKR